MISVELDRQRPATMRPSFFHHLHPPSVPARQARFRYTLGAGGLSVFLVLVLIVTGILEMFYYIPTPERAAQSVQEITFLVPYGSLVRGLHYWAAQFLVVVSILHLLRVIFTGAYAEPRRFNYLLGIVLLGLVLFLDFTGYVLRWDEGIRWALVAGTNLIRTIPGIGEDLYRFVMGSYQPGPATLIRFYAWHIFGLTLALAGIGLWHLFRVRRDGGIAVPPPALRADQERLSRDELVRREVLAMLIAGVILVVITILFPAPIAQPMDLMLSTGADSRAPWFFLWVQHLLRWGDPFVFGILIPLAILVFLIAIAYVLPSPSPEQLGRWFPNGGRISQILSALILLALIALSLLALFS
ncbi:MAG TPA: cytochrome b N-terminal domain-containing protein [Anaerolineales bacterium]